jgi:hypothetical protein
LNLLAGVESYRKIEIKTSQKYQTKCSYKHLTNEYCISVP